MYEAVPKSGFPPLSPNTVTVSTVEQCGKCMYQTRPVSHRVLWLCDVVRQLEEFKRKYPNG